MRKSTSSGLAINDFVGSLEIIANDNPFSLELRSFSLFKFSSRSSLIFLSFLSLLSTTSSQLVCIDQRRVSVISSKFILIFYFTAKYSCFATLEFIGMFIAQCAHSENKPRSGILIASVSFNNAPERSMTLRYARFAVSREISENIKVSLATVEHFHRRLMMDLVGR